MKRTKWMVVLSAALIVLMSSACGISTDSNITLPANENGKILIRGKITELTRYETSNSTEREKPVEPIDPDEPISSDQPSAPVPRDDVIGHLFVEGEVEADTETDVASITVTEDTQFFRQTNGEESPASFADMAHGAYVEVKTSIVRESYPPQADAEVIVILD